MKSRWQNLCILALVALSASTFAKENCEIGVTSTEHQELEKLNDGLITKSCEQEFKSVKKRWAKFIDNYFSTLDEIQKQTSTDVLLKVNKALSADPLFPEYFKGQKEFREIWDQKPENMYKDKAKVTKWEKDIIEKGAQLKEVSNKLLQATAEKLNLTGCEKVSEEYNQAYPVKSAAAWVNGPWKLSQLTCVDSKKNEKLVITLSDHEVLVESELEVGKSNVDKVTNQLKRYFYFEELYQKRPKEKKYQNADLVYDNGQILQLETSKSVIAKDKEPEKEKVKDEELLFLRATHNQLPKGYLGINSPARGMLEYRLDMAFKRGDLDTLLSDKCINVPKQ